MPYVKTTWMDEVPAGTLKYRISQTTSGDVAANAAIDLVTVVTAGTPVNAVNLNKIETGIETAQATAEASVQKSIVTAVGDLLYASAASVLARLAKPTVTALLQMTAVGTPTWQNESRYMLPVGSVFIAVVSTSPATLLGYGTWVAFATGRTLVGLDAGQTEFDVVEETGGAKAHTLITAEMPAHVHTYNRSGTAKTSSTGDADREYAQDVVETLSTGGGGAHNNLQPYIVVYMWERTA